MVGDLFIHNDDADDDAAASAAAKNKCPIPRRPKHRNDKKNGTNIKNKRNNKPNPNHIQLCNGPTYGEYLKLDQLLSSQHMLSKDHGETVADEHLFIITHQAYELWFKQILFDLDFVIKLFNAPILDETQQLRIVNLLDRVVKILKLLVDQILVLETMPPLEFVEFRRFLSPASGFQSFQFRMLENKLGLQQENRVLYNCQYYKEAFRCKEDRKLLEKTENDLSLLCLLQKWLERTPGLEENGFDFWKKYTASVQRFLSDQREFAESLENESSKDLFIAEIDKQKQSFDSILDPTIHNAQMKRGDRRFSHKALQGALLLSFYRDMPRFSHPYQILVLLMDIDSLLIKWRYNHLMLVQRMVGGKSGTGGSSGYIYLRATISDRYKIFLDLFNLSTWLIPKAYIPMMPMNIYLDLSRSIMIQHHDVDGEKDRLKHMR